MLASDLLTLAEAYARATRRSLATVGLRSCGNDQVFQRLARGKGCNSKTIERAADWFAEHWPPDVPWPLESPPPCPCRQEAAE
jgi:hypothetical protein